MPNWGQVLQEITVKRNQFAFCTVTKDEKSTGWVGGHGTCDSLACAVGLLSHRYFLSVMIGSDE